MTKKIYLIRHGQTDFNQQGIAQGSGVDTSLNEKGKAQARAFYQAYRDIPFDHVYTSSLNRTIESVQGFLDDGLPHTRIPELNEISWGIMEGKRFTRENTGIYESMVNSWLGGDYHMKVEAGESPQEVMDRIVIGMEKIIKPAEEKTILICMHGRAMRILLCYLLNYPLKYMDRFEHDNLCLYQLDYTGDLYAIKKFNDQSHLAGI